jgi:hypothetical protein
MLPAHKIMFTTQLIIQTLAEKGAREGAFTGMRVDGEEWRRV